MHVLIIPGEQLNNKNQFSSVFEIHQALALQKLNVNVGFISINLVGSIYKDIKNTFIKIAHFKSLISYNSAQNIQGINLVERAGKFLTPSFLNLYKIEKINAGIKAYKYYIEKFGKPDIIHAHSRFLISALIAGKIHDLYGIPFIITEHSSFHQRNMVSPKEYLVYSELINASKKWLVVSGDLGNIITSKIGNIKINKSFSVLPNFLDSNLKYSVKTRNGKYTFLHIAALDANKNQELLINSFNLLCKSNSNLELRIGGDGLMKDKLKSQIQRLNLQNVKLLGHLNREEIEREMINSNAFVLCSNYETFGVVLIESLAIGRPIISTKCGGPEHIVNEKNGILVEPNNIDQLTNAMEFMYKKYGDYDLKEISDDCIDKYGYKTIGNKLIEIYKQALN